MDPGTLIGGAYRVEARIGGGGMGSVYRARRISDGRAVALKVVRDATPDLVARLEREARITGAIEHPNMIRVYDVLRQDDGSPIVVMELLHGETLGARLVRESTLSVSETARIALGIIGALQAAHERSIVHRDLKPDNVFLTTVEGIPFVKVLDFGVAKAIDGGAIAAALPTLETRTGHIVGTPQYMAPEQIFGERDVDHRADVWALGVILYEALAGARPFDGENVGQVFKAIALDPPIPLADRDRSLPPALYTLVAKMLAHTRVERLSDLEEVRAVLEPLAAQAAPAMTDIATAPTVNLDGHVLSRSLDRPVSSALAKRPRRWVSAGLAVVVLSSIGTASLYVLRGRPSAYVTVAPSAFEVRTAQANGLVPAPIEASSALAAVAATPAPVDLPPARVVAAKVPANDRGARVATVPGSSSSVAAAGAPSPRAPRSGALRAEEF